MINMYSIYNKTLKQYYTPIFQSDPTEIKKTIFDVVNDKQDNYIKNCPANYCVYEVGKFDSKSGKIDVNRKPDLVVECAELVLKEQPNG